MTDLFNTSLTTGVYPALWKKALVVPLNKVSKPVTPSDIWAISNLGHFTKVFDKLVSYQFINYLEVNSLWSPYQSGFRKHFSTQSALIEITDAIRRGIENGMVTILLMFDLRKASDSVNHVTLLRVMHQLNCSNKFIDCFSSYLTSRSQAVIDLRAIAFIMLIHSTIDCLVHCSDFCILFADDF